MESMPTTHFLQAGQFVDYKKLEAVFWSSQVKMITKIYNKIDILLHMFRSTSHIQHYI